MPWLEFSCEVDNCRIMHHVVELVPIDWTATGRRVLDRVRALVPSRIQTSPLFVKNDIQRILVPAPYVLGIFFEAIKHSCCHVISTPSVQIQKHHATVKVLAVSIESKFTIVGNRSM